ncbi:DUF6934 family protein [Chitinophaga barathri]|uniref:Uncharacterized protein n=1 Tax=Chitinophaga barathri TaxID=1647451 RepID=A0A3N4MM95_9BACT|nr:hypothetical protein [Chitinophaga barathri]RPD43186.1 hypothetical protein EG028_02500 [Chitinophaga barathri]
MPFEKYEFVPNGDYTEFTFLSQGPRGRIRKLVSYSKLNERMNGETLYNLSFGDIHDAWVRDEDMYRIRSNNNDRDKVLATVAFTALEFAVRHPDCKIFVRGSTPARTRLYQMGINANWGYISELFLLKGYRRGQFEAFRPGVNYEFFTAQRRT